MKQVSIATLLKKKQENQKITMLTAYDHNMAALLDEAQVDVILVGDSLANVFAGEETTLNVTMDQMLYHVRVVARGARRALVVGDMPFGTFQGKPSDAFHNAADFLRAGARAVKLEGGQEVAQTVEYLTQRGIPVMGHIGLQPQSVHAYGGYRVRGKDAGQAEKIKQDARALERSGVFSIVLEAVPVSLAREVKEMLSVPVIGIGAGKHCDGQVLVINDLLGLSASPLPRFVKQYADLRKIILQAVRSYCEEVRTEAFPEDKHSYGD